MNIETTIHNPDAFEVVRLPNGSIVVRLFDETKYWPATIHLTDDGLALLHAAVVGFVLTNSTKEN